LGTFEERKLMRFRFLKYLYERTDGNEAAYAEVAQHLGVPLEEYQVEFHFLVEEGLVERSRGIVRLTHAGMVEIEKALSQPDKPTEHFPVNIIHIEQMSHSQIQQGTATSAQSTALRTEERTADTLSVVYESLDAFVDALRKYLHPAGNKEQSCKAFADACKHFENTFFPKRLYVPPDLFERVMELYRNATTIAEDFTNARNRVEKAADTEEDHHLWSEAIARLNAEVEPVFAEIISEFQNRIGVRTSRPQ